jgi:hypothetical protein
VRVTLGLALKEGVALLLALKEGVALGLVVLLGVSLMVAVAVVLMLGVRVAVVVEVAVAVTGRGFATAYAVPPKVDLPAPGQDVSPTPAESAKTNVSTAPASGESADVSKPTVTNMGMMV